MSNEKLIEYINLYNGFQHNPNMQFTNEQLKVITEVQQESKNNTELNELLSRLATSSEDERIKMLNEYLIEQEQKQMGTKEEEVISETYGIDISKIEHKYLDNGKEIFYFYDSKLGRNVVLENKKDGMSLVEQLKQMQLENKKFQIGTDEQNTNEMLNEQQNKENVEIKMIPVNEINNHMNELSNLNKEQMQKLNVLITNANSLGIQTINIENLIGIDSYGKLLEATYDKENNRYMINEPNTANYHEENINVSDRVDTNYTASEQYDNIQSNFEDKPEEITFDELSLEIQEQIKQYYEYPELIQMLPIEDQEKWKNYIALYEEKLTKEQELQNSMDKPKQYVLKKEEKKKAGYADVLLLSLITGFLAGVLTTLTMILLLK